jgi:sugar lactone lactonase YvrE
VEIELLMDAHATIGESPTWVAAEQAVYWIDVKAPALHRLELATRATRRWPLPSDIGGFALAEVVNAIPTAAVVALREGVLRLDLGSGTLTRLAPAPFDPVLTRFNEAACDSAGRFWIGTMFDPRPGAECDPVPAALHSFTLTGGLRHEPDAAELHNGMAWSADERLYYLAHSQRREIFTFRYDAATGGLGERQLLVSLSGEPGLPDGAAIDEEGGYWCALHGDSRLRRYLANGTPDREIMLPISQPTMCAFVGDALDLMVVTSASDKLTPGQLASQPHAGGLFCLRPGVKGVPRHCVVR